MLGSVIAKALEDRRPPLPRWVLAAGSTLVAATFLLDLALPAGTTAAVTYVAPVLLGLWAPRSRYPWVVAIVVSALTLVDPLVGGAGTSAPAALVDRAFVLFGTWSAAAVVIWHGRLTREVAAQRRATEDMDADLRRTVKELADFKAALDQSAIVATTDRRGTITYVNDKFCEISKYSREELLGKDHRIINSGYHSKEFMSGLWRTISQGRVWRGEIRNRAKDGSIYWVDTTIVPFVDASGLPYQHVAIRSDITARVLAQEALAERAALARLGEMAATVAHEVKNPLAGISGALQVIGGRMPADHPDKPIVGEMLARLAALDDMVQDLLRFALPHAPKLAPVALHALVGDVASLLGRDASTRDIEVATSGEDATVDADADQLGQVLLNLLLNAAHAMGGAGRVEVSTRTSGGEVELIVVDHGPGIPADVRARIFEPFFTTKHRGTGLGLATARRLVQGHGGRIEARDTPGGGATFEIVLPIRAGAAPAAADA